MAIDVGDFLPDFAFEVRDAAGVLANAGGFVVTLTLPDRTTQTPTVSNPSVGRYEVNYQTQQAGRHVARGVATGLNSSAHVLTWDVRPADPGYIVSLSDAKQHLNKTNTANDDEIRGFLEAVTEVAEYHCGPVVARAYTHRIRSGGYALALPRYPIVSVTSVTSIPDPTTTWLTADLDVDKAAGIVRLASGAPFTSGPWDAAYVAGRTVIPANITRGALIVLDHMWETQRGPSTTRRPPLRDEELVAVPGLSFTVPRRAVELFQPHAAAPGFA